MSFTVTVAAGDLPCLPYVLSVWGAGEPTLVAGRLCLTRAGAARAGRRAIERHARGRARTLAAARGAQRSFSTPPVRALLLPVAATAMR